MPQIMAMRIPPWRQMLKRTTSDKGMPVLDSAAWLRFTGGTVSATRGGRDGFGWSVELLWLKSERLVYDWALFSSGGHRGATSGR